MKIEKEGKVRKVRVIKIGLRKKTTIFFWILFLAAFVFAVYKNFTGVDTHTVHEVEVVETKIVDTNGIESFVKSFVRSYYTWENNSESLDNRQQLLGNYMTDELVGLNSGLISVEDAVSSSVSDINIWEVIRLDDSNFQVIYTVKQSIQRTVTETVTEYIEEPEINEIVNEETGEVSYQESVVQREVEKQVNNVMENMAESCYMVVVHADENGDMVIVQNPTISSRYSKSSYVPETVSGDGSVNSDTADEISAFLQKFFSLYPVADESELAYYVKNDALSSIGREYEFVGITDSVYKEVDGQITAYVTVKYYDSEAGINQLSQFSLGLEKLENWYIVSNALLAGA